MKSCWKLHGKRSTNQAVFHDDVDIQSSTLVVPFVLTPRVFSCVCFVHLLGPGGEKLDPKSSDVIS